jgi:GMP synthase-like glutamine amidotransferase
MAMMLQSLMTVSSIWIYLYWGICYGLQLMMDHFGGKVHSNGAGEYGFAKIHHEPDSRLLVQVQIIHKFG